MSGRVAFSEPELGLFGECNRLGNHKDDPHKGLWPLDWRDVVGYIFAAVSLFIAAGGGIGGGGILVPLYILVMGFPTNTAVALSNITIVGGAISNFVFNVGRRHAFFNRPLIDWNIILAMEPATILGALLGGYLNKATPNWMTTILLAALLTLLTYKLVDRAVVTWRKENLEFKRAAAGSSQDGSDPSEPLLRKGPQEQQEILNEAFAPEQSPRQSTQPIAAGARPSTESALVSFSGQDPAHKSSPLTYTSLGNEGAEGAHLGSSLGGSFRSSSLIRRVSLIERARIASLSNVHGAGEGSNHHEPAIAEDAQGMDLPWDPTWSPLEAPSTCSLACFPCIQLPLTLFTEREVSIRCGVEWSVVFADNNLITSYGGAAVAGPVAAGAAADEAAANDVAEKIEAAEPQVPPLKLALLFLMFACIVASDSFKDRTVCGTWQYWLVVLSVLPVILIITLFVRAYLVRDFNAKQASGYVWTEGDVEWSRRNTLLFPALSSLAGLIAGMFGVGGGIVKGPLMLEMGVLPDVAAATSATMIMFTAASASVVYLSFGGIPFDYGLATFLVGLIFTMVGQVTCYWLMKALDRRSVVVIAMALLMVISMVIIYYEAVVSTIAAVQDHRLLDFGTICVGQG
ncbi:hypothetical protein COCSUDRAFT_47913 [Coccomyxa subellipsoidea C-169]|uniref:Sulfite exporter TauE/SafE n=1 Tax=Coccomyxa subellipsoidea (strain C-169) TaxID=574566 RepID=I0YVS4_COCSC|nr:hypothetical protein COCSUDRAFT_47913 [Coccomyxa subellipsoidea C-169]EIE22493.1 hypothetical protein COCSUDRAFT_47913 [Coccomyxa subellipsoidea C-169]|eukprot:XP_005647037.1 hypothetical protein COCSUDRAFT_47913 [Coccomyxa subellipsoidea C-169]